MAKVEWSITKIKSVPSERIQRLTENLAALALVNEDVREALDLLTKEDETLRASMEAILPIIQEKLDKLETEEPLRRKIAPALGDMVAKQWTTLVFHYGVLLRWAERKQWISVQNTSTKQP